MLKLILAAALLTACSTIPQTTPVGTTPTTYRSDLTITVSGATFDGIAVTKLTKAGLPITVQSPIAMDRVDMTSCARQDVVTAQGSQMTYSYIPAPQELDGMCPLFVEVFSKKDLLAWGIVLFRSLENLPSHDFINGEGISFAGISAGQTKAGLEQTIDFTQPVKYAASTACSMKTDDNKHFTYSPVGVCTATFGANSPTGPLRHRLWVNGYSQVLIR